MYAANDIASVILERTGSWLDAMSLQKLLYYVQAWHLSPIGRCLRSRSRRGRTARSSRRSGTLVKIGLPGGPARKM